jgi:hypothetical protein
MLDGKTLCQNRGSRLAILPNPIRFGKVIERRTHIENKKTILRSRCCRFELYIEKLNNKKIRPLLRGNPKEARMSYLQNHTPEALPFSRIFHDREPEPKYEKGTAADIPQYEIDALARAFLPAILKFYRSEEGQREFAEWKANRDKQKLNNKKN